MEQNKILDLSARDGKLAAELYRQLSRKGEKIGETDYLIAAQAERTNRKLITRDRDFQKLEIEKIQYEI